MLGRDLTVHCKTGSGGFATVRFRARVGKNLHRRRARSRPTPDLAIRAWYAVGMLLRPETASDAFAIRSLVSAAFHDAPHASGTEADIVDALREDGALTVSLVCAEADEIVGHVAFSPVVVGLAAEGWFGLGPLAVRRENRRKGIGRRLVEAGLDSLRTRDAGGCVVLGDPNYYRRFGLVADPAIRLAGVPPVYFQSLSLCRSRPEGEVRYHSAFGVA